MDLENLYNLAEKENIKIYNWQIDETYGMYLNYNNINAIALNYNTLGTYIDEKCTLAEELGHYYMNATYFASTTDKILKEKQEYRARKWSYYVLIPVENLKLAIKNGFNNLYSLADFFEVTEEYMRNCIQFYINKYGDVFNV